MFSVTKNCDLQSSVNWNKLFAIVFRQTLARRLETRHHATQWPVTLSLCKQNGRASPSTAWSVLEEGGASSSPWNSQHFFTNWLFLSNSNPAFTCKNKVENHWEAVIRTQHHARSLLWLICGKEVHNALLNLNGIQWWNRHWRLEPDNLCAICSS